MENIGRKLGKKHRKQRKKEKGQIGRKLEDGQDVVKRMVKKPQKWFKNDNI